ncbi:MAG: hypothetical protein GY703_11670 [Gammaproteobacteria bacterium]|nr:hypothetical protein [Gammaproteobacteria bacterium]
MGTELSGKCWNCSVELGPLDYGREDVCSGCRKPVRVCRNCRWYSPGRPNACEEPMAEEVMDKERANYCGFFEPTTPADKSGDTPSADELKKAAEDLFKF